MFWQDNEDWGNYPSSDESGSEQRFHGRLAVFKEQEIPPIRHHLWWVIHNCISHPMIGVAPCKFTFDFHDYTSKKINAK